MSLVVNLYKKELIAQKNAAQYQMLKNSASQRTLLSTPYFGSNLNAASRYENALEMENIDNSTQLMAIDAELDAINNSKLDYLA